MEKLNIFDLHVDTATKWYLGESINSENIAFKLKDALKYNKYIQVFAVYIDPEYVKGSKFDYALDVISTIKREEENNIESMCIIQSKKEIIDYENLCSRKLGMILSIEDASCLNGNISNLYKLYEKGIRMIGLTWNTNNEIGTGAYHIENTSGLTIFGEEVVKKMNEIGCIVDVSHLSKKSFYDVMNISKKPVVASHSCASGIYDHERNLDDLQIKMIADKGGIIGLNFYSLFISPKNHNVDINMLVEHIQHIYDLAGIDCIALGSDFDGMNKPMEGLVDNSMYINLKKCLQNRSFTNTQINKIMWENAYNFFKENLR